MTYAEIVKKLLEKDQEVTECFFYYSGPTIEEIRDIRRKDPQKAAKIKPPICNSFYRCLVKILYSLHEPDNFDYKDWVSAFQYYLIAEGKLKDIKDPQALPDWINKTASGFFLRLIIDGVDPKDYHKINKGEMILKPGGKGKEVEKKQNLDFYKKRKNGVVRLDDEPDFDEGGISNRLEKYTPADALAMRHEIQQNVREAISMIKNEKYREILLLGLKYPDTSHKELADLLGITETNYGARLLRAREQFKKKYETLIK